MTLAPEEEPIDARIQVRAIHSRTDDELAKMLAAVTDKSTRFDEPIDRLENFPGERLAQLKYDNPDSPITGAEADAEVADELAMLTAKRTRLLDKKFLIEQERAFRRDGKVTR